MSRTIADLEGTEPVMSHHVAEAVQYRLFNREVDAWSDPAVADSLLSKYQAATAPSCRSYVNGLT